MAARVAAMLFGLLIAITPSSAREITAPADTAWTHAATGFVLPPMLDGFARRQVIDSTASEHDVSVSYVDEGTGTLATIYIFHSAMPDIPLWFDRASVTMANGPMLKNPVPVTAEPVAFALPGSATPSSLRRAFSTSGRARSTASSDAAR